MAWAIPIAIAIASRIAQDKLAKKNNGGPATPTPGGNNSGLIFEQGSPYFPGSDPRFPSNWQQQATGQTGGGGGGGGSSSESTSKSVSDTVANSTVQPFILPQFSGLANGVFGQVQNRIDQPYSLPRGYQATGIANINDAYDLAGKSIENRLTSSGLGGGPMAAAAYAGAANDRAKVLSGFQNDLPLQERQLRTEDLQLASAILDSFGKGQKSTTTSRTTTNSRSTGTSSGGGGGGTTIAPPMLGDALAQQYFAAQGNKQQGGSWLDKALGYAALAAGIYASIRGGK